MFTIISVNAETFPLNTSTGETWRLQFGDEWVKVTVKG